MTKRSKDPVPRSVLYSTIYDPRKSHKSQETILDKCVILYFQGPHSYTGEDVLELQLHGGNAIVRSVLSALHYLSTNKTSTSFINEEGESQALRYAEAGEFSLRAFQNGVFDLTQIEGIRDSIDAETEMQRQATLAGSNGLLKEKYESWRNEIVDSMALLTALIDFSEDSGDVAESASELFTQARHKMTSLLSEIKSHQDKVQRSKKLLVDGIKLDLLGPPNAGKSFLVNRLVEKDTAIVSDVPGTTRDILEVPIDIGGFKLVMGDTAGLRKHESFVKSIDSEIDSEEKSENSVAMSAMKIEMEGIRRAKARFKNSDIILTVIPLSEDSTTLPTISNDIIEEVQTLKSMGKNIIAVLNKSDLLKDDSSQQLKDYVAQKLDISSESIILTSCTKNKGIDQLVDRIESLCKYLYSQGNAGSDSGDSQPISASQRTMDLLQNDVIAGIENFLSIEDENDVVIATEELRFAAEGIGKITGQGVGIEEILGVVFSSFCIGK